MFNAPYAAFTVVLIAVALPCQAPAQCGLVGTIMPTKGSYVTGEPTEMQLTVTNTSTLSSQFVAAYPWFSTIGHSGVTIAAKADSTAVSRVPPPPLSRSSLVSLGPGESWSVRLFLARFLLDLSPGTHEFAYSVDIPCRGPGVKIEAPPRNRGDFQIVVLSASERELPDVLSRYGEELGSTEYWTRRTAEEALCATNSPIVLPYLRRLLEIGLTDCGISAMAKFKANAETESILLATIRDGTISQALAALSVLNEWNRAIEDVDFRYVLNRDDPGLRVAALRYAEKIGRAAYKPAVSSHTDDSDEWVAREAKRVEAVLITGQVKSRFQ